MFRDPVKHLIKLGQFKTSGILSFDLYPEYSLREEPKLIGGRWSAQKGAWQFPAVQASIENLIRLYGKPAFRVDERIVGRIQHKWGFKEREIPADSFEPLPEETVKALEWYQNEAIEFLLSSPHPGSLLGLSPGTGKTLVSLAAASNKKRVLIVSPFSLMLNWQLECERWLHRKLNRCYKTGPTATGWVVTNYDTLMRQKSLYQRHWDVIIVDESILVKNPDAKRTEAVALVRKDAEKLWLLSGSPISRYADDLFSQLQLIYPTAFTSYWRFAKTYCRVEETKWGDKVIGNNTTIDLRYEFRDLMYIKDKREVLPDLPEPVYETINCEMVPEQDRIYGEMQTEFITQLETGEEMSATAKVAQLVRLQQIVSNPANFGPEWPDISGKRNTLVELIESGYIETPAIIWAHWKEGAVSLSIALQTAFDKRYKIALVRSKDPKRDELIMRFIRGGLDIIIMSPGIGKYGHNLTNAKTMVYYDKTWDADAYIQSIARVERKGLNHRPLILSLVCPGTTDQLIQENLQDKSRAIAHVTNNNLAGLLRSLNDARPRV